MALKVHTNIAALRQINQLNNNQRQVGASIERVSSGLRINNAADDAAGTGLSGEMNSKNVSLRRAMKNVNDGVSLVHTAEGALNEINDILVRMRELALQSSNATYSNQDRTNLNAEFTQMRIDIGRIASNTHFNDIKLLDNALTTTLSIQVGIYDGQGNQVQVNLSEISASQGALSISALSVDTITKAQDSLVSIDGALDKVINARSKLGAIQQTLEVAIGEATTYSENLTASVSQIVDLDYAAESANLTRFQIMQEASQATFTQAKNLPQSIVNLLG